MKGSHSYSRPFNFYNLAPYAMRLSALFGLPLREPETWGSLKVARRILKLLLFLFLFQKAPQASHLSENKTAFIN